MERLFRLCENQTTICTSSGGCYHIFDDALHLFVRRAVLSGKPNRLAQIQAASFGSGPSAIEGTVAVLIVLRRKAGIRQPSASQK